MLANPNTLLPVKAPDRDVRPGHTFVVTFHGVPLTPSGLLTDENFAEIRAVEGLLPTFDGEAQGATSHTTYGTGDYTVTLSGVSRYVGAAHIDRVLQAYADMTNRRVSWQSSAPTTLAPAPKEA